MKKKFWVTVLMVMVLCMSFALCGCSRKKANDADGDGGGSSMGKPVIKKDKKAEIKRITKKTGCKALDDFNLVLDELDQTWAYLDYEGMEAALENLEFEREVLDNALTGSADINKYSREMATATERYQSWLEEMEIFQRKGYVTVSVSDEPYYLKEYPDVTEGPRGEDWYGWDYEIRDAKSDGKKLTYLPMKCVQDSGKEEYGTFDLTLKMFISDTNEVIYEGSLGDVFELSKDLELNNNVKLQSPELKTELAPGTYELDIAIISPFDKDTMIHHNSIDLLVYGPAE